MEGDQSKQSRQRVRLELITPLVEMGMVRKRGVSVEDHEKMLARIADRLAYMSEPNLRGLREFVIRLAGGKAGNVWPAEVSIVRSAYNIQVPPPRKSDYAQSLIRSVMGQRAHDEGWLVELFRIARRIGPPPNRYIIAKLKDKAGSNRSKRARIAEYIEAGRASREELAWLDQYHSDLAECMAIIEAKTEEAAA